MRKGQAEALDGVLSRRAAENQALEDGFSGVLSDELEGVSRAMEEKECGVSRAVKGKAMDGVSHSDLIPFLSSTPFLLLEANSIVLLAV